MIPQRLTHKPRLTHEHTQNQMQTDLQTLKPLSHRDSGKYTGNVFRESSRDRLILVHSHCLRFSGICACVHTQPVKTRDISCDVYNAPRTISLNWMISASARIVRSSDRCFIPVYTFFVVNVDLPSKHPVKQSNDKVRHHYDAPFTALIRLLFTQRSFWDWTRQCY